MDGLEAVEVKLSFVRQNNSYFFRYDSEYYKKVLLDLTNKISSIKNITIDSCYDVSKLAGFEYTEYFTPRNMSSENHYIAVTSKNIQKCELVLNEYITIDKQIADQFLKRSKLKRSDVILSYTGEYRRALTLMTDNFQLGPNVCRLRPRNDVVNSYYLALFFNSYVGQLLLDREKTMSAQPTVAMERIRQIAVPIFDNLQITLKQYHLNANQKIGASKNCYHSAEKLLEKKLDFAPCLEDSVNFTVKTLSNGFCKTGRLDAEYYQPKYEEYERAIEKNSNGYTLIKNQFYCVADKCARNLCEYPYIEIGDIDIANGSYACNVVQTNELPENAKIMTKSGDVLVSTVRPNRGAVTILEEDDLLVSGAFTVLRSFGNYSKEVLQVLLRTRIYRDWFLKYNVGTSYPVIKDADVLNMPIPIFDEKTEKEITDKVQESFRLRKEAKLLLDKAIKAVEMAIETDEDTALTWLASQEN